MNKPLEMYFCGTLYFDTVKDACNYAKNMLTDFEVMLVESADVGPCRWYILQAPDTMVRPWERVLFEGWGSLCHP
jgi:hypothetical protein